MQPFQIDESQAPSIHPVLNLGFRPFFLGAGFIGAFSLSIWLWTYWTGQSLYPMSLPGVIWHVHELVFGYAAAVITGFLLTAAKNWTNQQTLHQLPLLLLVLCWLFPRLLLVIPGIPLWQIAALDLLFNIGLFVAVAQPIFRVKQRRQYPILGKIIFLLICNSLFYAEALGLTENTARGAVYFALFVVLALILMMSRRLIPSFTENGLNAAGSKQTPPQQKIVLKNARWADLSSLFLFVSFLVAYLIFKQAIVTATLAGVLAVVLAVRAIWWYHPSIWSKPLLWGLHLAYYAQIIGFAGFALSPFGWFPPLLAMHTLTIGGIGIITLAMMARVSIGHTGRDIHQPPKAVSLCLKLVAIAWLVRVVGGMIWPEYYRELVIVSGLSWIAAMLVFLRCLLPILWKPRIDQRYG